MRRYFYRLNHKKPLSGALSGLGDEERDEEEDEREGGEEGEEFILFRVFFLVVNQFRSEYSVNAEN